MADVIKSVSQGSITFVAFAVFTCSAICCSICFAAEAPEISTLRYDEDYSYLREPAAESARWWEPLKYIPLNDAGDIYLTLGNEARIRYELLRNDNFGEGPQDNDGYLWLRDLPLADLHAGEHIRLFGQLITAFEIDREPFNRDIDENRFDILQIFADARFPLPRPDQHATFRVGRQMLSYGSDRLISNRYGPNVPETFDGVKTVFELERWKIDAFWMRPVKNDLRVLDDESNKDRALWSLYSTRHFDAERKNGFDAYYIGYENENATFNQGTDWERRHTLGTRLFGNTSGWDWNGEGFYQFGSFGHGDIRAWSVGTDTGYTFMETPSSPRLSLKANIISGDDDPTDVDLQTFNPLFPKGKYFGEIGLLGPYNLINLHPTLELTLNKSWSATFAAVFYWRESTGDGIYDNAGNLLRPATGSRARYIGTQADVVFDYRFNRNLQFQISASSLFQGRFIEETGRSKTAYFVGSEIVFSF